MKKISFRILLMTWMLLPAAWVAAQTLPEELPPTKGIALKMNPFNLLNGNFPLLAEFRISQTLSLETGVGITGKDLIFDLGRHLNQPEFTSRTLADPGYSASFGIRYFYSDKNEALRGAYFQPTAEYRFYQGLVSTCVDPLGAAPLPNYLPESRNRYYFRILFGYQTVSRGNFIFDFYTGLGMRYRNSNVCRCEVVEGIGQIPVVKAESTIGPSFAAGFKIGFGL